MRRRFGFTLMEMLVVIALLTLLIAMILPSLRRAKASARAVICGSKLGQIGDAMQSYVDDHRYYPVGIDEHPKNELRIWLWPPQLRMYTQGESTVMHCPSAPQDTIWRAAYGSGEPGWYGYYKDEVRILGMTHKFSYGYNVWGANIGVVPNPGLGVYRGNPHFGETHFSRVVRPSDMVAFADSTISDYWSGYIGIYRVGQYPSEIHFGRANFLFADTHVELIETATMIDISDDAVNRRWNVDHQVH